MSGPGRKSFACLGSLFIGCLAAVRGSEVYLSRITIYKTHDRFFPPTVYFKCPDDNRAKRYFSDVKATNHTYIVAEESVALTHISSEYCQADCGIYDQDLFDKDDLFGSTFKLCDSNFDQTNNLYEITVPGEVTLELYCPHCNPYVAPPPPLIPGPDGVPIPANSDTAKSSNATAEETELEKLLPKGDKLKKVLILIVLAAVFLGFLLGFVVHRCYRAFSDASAEDARRRFQALYADPHTEIEDLPTAMPSNRNTGLTRFARSMRGILGANRGQSQPPSLGQRGDAHSVPFHQLKVQEEEIEIPDES